MTDNLLVAYALRQLFDVEGRPVEVLAPEVIASLAYRDAEKSAAFLRVIEAAIASKRLAVEKAPGELEVDHIGGKLNIRHGISRRFIHRDVMRAWLKEAHALDSASDELRAWWPELAEERLTASKNASRGAAASACSRKQQAEARNKFLKDYVDEAISLVKNGRSGANAAQIVFDRHHKRLKTVCEAMGWDAFTHESIRQRINKQRSETGSRKRSES